jgi:uncharacterized membrane protein SirB2
MAIVSAIVLMVHAVVSAHTCACWLLSIVSTVAVGIALAFIVLGCCHTCGDDFCLIAVGLCPHLCVRASAVIAAGHAVVVGQCVTRRRWQ